MTDIDPALEEKILGGSQRHRKANIHHRNKTNDLGRGVEALEQAVLSTAPSGSFASNQTVIDVPR